ncbi:MAG: hypothetical protein JNL95_07745 [Chitinophagales bacterium]|nr:hypothetical protein [Chitinophagales bacterium]
MEEQNNIRKYENLHILIWLIKDLCWVTLSRQVGVAMIIPTLSMAIYITWVNRKTWSELAHNLAICCWICANSSWMIGEFYFQDGLRPYAISFFVIGLVIVSVYYLSLMLKKWKN